MVHMLVIKRLHSCAVHTGFRVVAFRAEKIQLKRKFCSSTWLDQAPLALFHLYACDWLHCLSKRRVGQHAFQTHLLSILSGTYGDRHVSLHILGTDEVMEATSSCLICWL